ncbi:MAG: hypothetical protein HQL69_09025 [Magnetococcales bacterium]|nr:hypothetical protein [Magnetococcales bacterium]
MAKKRIWCAVSGHGFGHFSQVYPILNQLIQDITDLEITVAGSIPQRLLDKYIEQPCIHVAQQQDVGLVQPDPLQVDLTATARQLRNLHNNWQQRVSKEMAAIKSFAADLVLADIPYLPIEAAFNLGIPSVAVASLSWDHVTAAYFDMTEKEPSSWRDQMVEAYAKTTLALLPEPAIMGDTFPVYKTTPPLTTPATARKDSLREDLRLLKADNRPLVLVSLGGFPSQTLPIQKLEMDSRFHWLLDYDVNKKHDHIHRVDLLPQWSFRNLSASVDAIVSKPGYGMSIAATVDGVPYLYVRRGRFPDEKIIGDWIEKNNRAMEIEKEDFYAGKWGEKLITLLQMQPPKPTTVDGAKIAASYIKKLMNC